MRGPRGRGVAATALALALVTTGCTYSDREGGLFERTPDAVESPAASPAVPPNSSGPIPLLGEATWMVADRRGIPIRIAVHGLRRVPRGTVLDWSITALSPPGGVSGEPIPGGLSIDIDEQTDVALVDAAARVYRPLVAKDSGRCLCVSFGLAQQNLAYDVPRLLQVAYPALPADLRVVDVSIALVPVFSRVPVAPLGEVAAPTTQTDLAAPVEWPVPVERTPEFRLANGQLFAIEVIAVLASGTLTSVVWTLESRSPGPGPPRGLQPTLTRSGAWRVLPVQVEPAEADDAGCLCADPARWRGHLTEPGRRVTVVTTLGEIPRGATTVDVDFTEVSPLTGISVRPASDAALRTAGTVPGPDRTWSFRPDRRGWSLSSWPTPVPVISKGRFLATVDRILG